MSLSRRTFLKGSGGALMALPWMESIAAEKKAKPAQATGQQQKLITYTPETRKLPVTEVVKKDLVPVNPRLQTGDLQMGEKVQPLFGSST